MNTDGRTKNNNINHRDYIMSQDTKVKPIVDKLMLAGFGSGCLLFAMGTLTKIPPLSVFGFLASTGAGSVSYINTRNQLIEQKNKKKKTLQVFASIDPKIFLKDIFSNDFFAKYIQEPDGIEKLETIIPDELSDSQKNIFNNTKFLIDQIKNKLPQQCQKQRLTDFLLNRCSLGIICTSNFDAAYRIFSVLNDRGLDLSITDILKADLIGAISQQNLVTSQDLINLQNKYTQKWEDLEEKLGRDDFTKLFSHIRMIYQKNKLQQKIIEEFRVSVLTNIKNTPEFIDEILDPFADAFYKIKNQTFMGNNYCNEINQLFKWLHRINNQDWYPPAILYLKKYGHKPEKIFKFFTNLERLAAGLMLMKANVNRRIKRYSEILKMIETEGDLYRVDSPLQLSNLEKQDIINVLNGNLYQMGKMTLYILLRLDTFLSDGVPNYDGYKNITIEHILPQNPQSDSQWNQWFPTQQTRDKYVHRLGNLVLLSRQKNSAAQNYEFAVKKDKYLNNPIAIFALTIQAIKEKEWTPEIIEQRQTYLLSQLQSLWSLTLWDFEN